MTELKMRRAFDQPMVTMTNWRVFVLEDGRRHIVGLDVEQRSRRVSSIVEAFDAISLEALVETGYRYVLTGTPGPDEHQDVEHTWMRWAAVHAGQYWTDLTEQLWHEHSRIRTPAA